MNINMYAVKKIGNKQYSSVKIVLTKNSEDSWPCNVDHLENGSAPEYHTLTITQKEIQDDGGINIYSCSTLYPLNTEDIFTILIENIEINFNLYEYLISVMNSQSKSYRPQSGYEDDISFYSENSYTFSQTDLSALNQSEEHLSLEDITEDYNKSSSRIRNTIQGYKKNNTEIFGAKFDEKYHKYKESILCPEVLKKPWRYQHSGDNSGIPKQVAYAKLNISPSNTTFKFDPNKSEAATLTTHSLIISKTLVLDQTEQQISFTYPEEELFLNNWNIEQYNEFKEDNNIKPMIEVSVENISVLASVIIDNSGKRATANFNWTGIINNSSEQLIKSDNPNCHLIISIHLENESYAEEGNVIISANFQFASGWTLVRIENGGLLSANGNIIYSFACPSYDFNQKMYYSCNVNNETFTSLSEIECIFSFIRYDNWNGVTACFLQNYLETDFIFLGTSIWKSHFCNFGRNDRVIQSDVLYIKQNIGEEYPFYDFNYEVEYKENFFFPFALVGWAPKLEVHNSLHDPNIWHNSNWERGPCVCGDENNNNIWYRFEFSYKGTGHYSGKGILKRETYDINDVLVNTMYWFNVPPVINIAIQASGGGAHLVIGPSSYPYSLGLGGGAGGLFIYQIVLPYEEKTDFIPAFKLILGRGGGYDSENNSWVGENSFLYSKNLRWTMAGGTGQWSETVKMVKHWYPGQSSGENSIQSEEDPNNSYRALSYILYQTKCGDGVPISGDNNSSVNINEQITSETSVRFQKTKTAGASYIDPSYKITAGGASAFANSPSVDKELLQYELRVNSVKGAGASGAPGSRRYPTVLGGPAYAEIYW